MFEHDYEMEYQKEIENEARNLYFVRFLPVREIMRVYGLNRSTAVRILGKNHKQKQLKLKRELIQNRLALAEGRLKLSTLSEMVKMSSQTVQTILDESDLKLKTSHPEVSPQNLDAVIQLFWNSHRINLEKLGPSFDADLVTQSGKMVTLVPVYKIRQNQQVHRLKRPHQRQDVDVWLLRHQQNMDFYAIPYYIIPTDKNTIYIEQEESKKKDDYKVYKNLGELLL